MIIMFRIVTIEQGMILQKRCTESETIKSVFAFAPLAEQVRIPSTENTEQPKKTGVKATQLKTIITNVETYAFLLVQMVCTLKG